MHVTINTDASFLDKHKIGGYAFWIVYNGIRIKQAGFLAKVENSTEAEIQAIANALHVLLKADIGKVSKILINTDSKGAMSNISKWKGKSYAAQLSRKYLYQLGDVFEFRHVKAHSHTKTPRNWVNDWCDKESRREMRKGLKQLNK